MVGGGGGVHCHYCHHHHHHHHFHCQRLGLRLFIALQLWPLRRQEDRQTDRQTRQTDRPDQAPKQPQESTDTVLASVRLAQNPKTLPTWIQRWLTKKTCVCPACTSLVEKNSTAPYHQGQGRSPFPTSTHTR